MKRGDSARARERVRAKREEQTAKVRASREKAGRMKASEVEKTSHHQREPRANVAREIVLPRPEINFPRAWRGGPVLGPLEVNCLRKARKLGMTLVQLLDDDPDDFTREDLVAERRNYGNPIAVPSRRRPDLSAKVLTASIREDPESNPIRGGNVSLNTWLIAEQDMTRELVIKEMRRVRLFEENDADIE